LSKKGSKGIIAEFKRQSPSKGIINKDADIKQVTEAYLNAGASAQSILTDTAFFGGSIMDLIEARTVNSNVPILRKDFIVDAFQIVESKAIGADAILLIAACLTAKELKQFGGLASDLGLEVLYEVHDRSDLDKLDVSQGLIGINNRDLKTFKVDLENSIEMVKELPSTTLKVAESGISDPKIVTGLRQYGFDGFLIGEQFMKSNDPGSACKDFIDQLD
jgi:indole-3-glycerol phosphate synthase